jgi:hypothetical protein
MLGSLAPLYGSRLLAIVPTGIGSDGCKGSQAVAAAGGCSADFDTPAKTRVLEGMANMLAPDGFLYLGGAETVLGETIGSRSCKVGAGSAVLPRRTPRGPRPRAKIR